MQYIAGRGLLTDSSQGDADRLEFLMCDPDWQNPNCSKVPSYPIPGTTPVSMPVMISVPWAFCHTIESLSTDVYMSGCICSM